MKRNISVEMNISGHLPDITYDYVQYKQPKKFYGRSFKIENFKNQIIDKRNFCDKKRKILVEVLKDQNKNYHHVNAYNDIDLLLKKIFCTSISFSINKGYLKNALILNGLNSFGYVLTKICHKRNISCIFWENGLYEGTLFINSYGVNAYGRKNISFL